MDAYLEKPMVMNMAEAQELIRLRERGGRLVMVAFPAAWEAKRLIAEGALGQVTAGTWRQEPEVPGRGFLFDTGWLWSIPW